MSFNTALSGLKAASSDLQITGNNIANASTVGFKESRAEFGDVYAASLISGPSSTGNGVKLDQVSQRFDQGTFTFTGNSLDLGIDGGGFFVLSDDGAAVYTRAGMFGLDSAGYMVSNSGMRVQGYGANDSGTVSGIQGDLLLRTDNIDPRQTTRVDTNVNLDANATVLARFGTTIDTTGTSIGVAVGGLAADTPSVLNTSAAPTPFDFSVNSASAISSGAPTIPFDFSQFTASAVTAPQSLAGYDFSVNTASSPQ